MNKDISLAEIGSKKCLICLKNTGKARNNTLYYHIDNEDNQMWMYCNRCERGYAVQEYCQEANISLNDFLQQKFEIKESVPNEVQKVIWPNHFIPLFDPRAKPGVEYLASRGLNPADNLYYDIERNGIVFPHYYHQVFCGAQIRLIEPWVNEDGDLQKISTIFGTRTALLFYNWNQDGLPSSVKGVIVAEGALNALSIQQALYNLTGGILKCPYKIIATSGSGLSLHKLETLKELKDMGYSVCLAPDSDDGGMKMLEKAKKFDAITHFALTNMKYDWNDILCSMSDSKEFVEFFKSQVIEI